MGTSAGDELCGGAGHPLWPGLRLAASAGRADGPSGSGYPAGGGASRPTASGRRPRDRALHGATLARLAEGLSDTPVTLAAKSLLGWAVPSSSLSRRTTGWALPGRTSPGSTSASTIILCLTGRMTPTPSPRASRHGSSCCPRRWKRRWKGGNYSRCCNVRVDERRLFRQESVVY